MEPVTDIGEPARRDPYVRKNPVAQFGANTLHKIYGHVNDTADRLGVDRRDAQEIAGRVLDMLEVGAERIGSQCPKCGAVCDESTNKPAWRFGGMISYPECPTHGAFTGRLIIAFPSTDDTQVPE